MPLDRITKRIVWDTILQKVIDAATEVLAHTGTALSRTEVGSKVLVKVLTPLRDMPLLLAVAKETVESVGPQTIKNLVEAELERRHVTGEAHRSILDATDDILEALGKRGAEALTPASIDAYIVAATARIAAADRAAGAIDTTSTTIQPGTLTGPAGGTMPDPTPATPVAHKKRISALMRHLETDEAKRLLHMWTAPLRAAKVADKSGEVAGARERIHDLRVALDEDPAGLATILEDAAHIWGVTAEAIEYVDGLTMMNSQSARAQDVIGDTGDAMIPGGEVAKATKMAFKMGVASAQAFVITILALGLLGTVSIGTQVYLAGTNYVAATTTGGQVDVKLMGASTVHFVAAVVIIFLMLGLFALVKGVIGAIIHAAGEPFAWLSSVLKGRFGIEASAPAPTAPPTTPPATGH